MLSKMDTFTEEERSVYINYIFTCYRDYLESETKDTLYSFPENINRNCIDNSSSFPELDEIRKVSKIWINGIKKEYVTEDAKNLRMLFFLDKDTTETDALTKLGEFIAKLKEADEQ